MPENIRDLSLGEVLTIPIELTVVGLSTDIGFRRYDTVRLENEDLGIDIYLQDSAYDQLVQEVIKIEKRLAEEYDNGMDPDCSR